MVLLFQSSFPPVFPHLPTKAICSTVQLQMPDMVLIAFSIGKMEVGLRHGAPSKHTSRLPNRPFASLCSSSNSWKDHINEVVGCFKIAREHARIAMLNSQQATGAKALPSNTYSSFSPLRNWEPPSDSWSRKVCFQG